MYGLEIKVDIDEAIQKRIVDEFFVGSEITYRPGLEGQRVEEGHVVIGDKAGPGRDLGNLCHEMSHFVEIDDRRMGRPGWGLRVPEVWVFDRMCCEPTTMQMTAREMRVIAFQANLMEYLGIQGQLEGAVQSMRFMPDFYMVPEEEPRTDVKSYRDYDATRLRWISKRVEELRKVHTLDVFLSEWSRKNKVLRRRLTKKRKAA